MDKPQRIVARIAGVAAAGTTRQTSPSIVRQLHLDYFLVALVKTGTRTVRGTDGVCECTAGQAMLMTPGTYEVMNMLPSHGGYESEWLAWSTSLVRECSASRLAGVTWGAKRIAPLPLALTECFTKARDAVNAHPAVPQRVAALRVEELMVWLEHQGIQLAVPSAQPLSGRIRALVSSAPANEWTTADFASRFAMSESTLRRRLAIEGVSASDLLREARMWHAMILLQSTDLPVARIALDCGYESASRFAARFKARFGFPPTYLRGHQRDGG